MSTTEPGRPGSVSDPASRESGGPASAPSSASVPPVSSRDQPRFGSAERKAVLAAAFQDQGDDYDRLRPGYPDAVIDVILAHLPEHPAHLPENPRLPRAVDLGAGTGKLSWALADHGFEVTAVDTSEAMLRAALRRGTSAARPTPASAPSAAHPTPASAPAAEPLTIRVAPAERTGLPGGRAHLVTAAQAWHWFDAPAATAEAARLLAPGGILALLWNTLDVAIPWVHRLSRIMHAGDVQREDFLPDVGPQLVLADRHVHRWEDPMPTQDAIDLARTRSYVITAPVERRAQVLANLDWYLHDHLGHEVGSIVGVPYRTDLFLYRRAED